MHLLSRDFRHLGAHVRAVEDAAYNRDATGAPIEVPDATDGLEGQAADLYAALHAVLHAITGAATRLGLYRMPECHPELDLATARLAALTKSTAEAIQAFARGAGRGELIAAAHTINHLSRETEVAVLQAETDLTRATHEDPLVRIMWQEIYEHIRTAACKCHLVTAILVDGFQPYLPNVEPCVKEKAP
ncbi:MAG: hypothetical protein ACP5VE_13805 [Chthonomonadales bacterium]